MTEIDGDMNRKGLQIAFCRLILKDNHWLPFGINSKLTESHRSAPGGPVIHATVMADVGDREIVGWRNTNFAVYEVAVDGEVQSYDPGKIAAVLSASHSDQEAESVGAVGINRELVKRRREAEQSRVPEHHRLSALERAAIQIKDKLHGVNAVGVTLIDPE